MSTLNPKTWKSICLLSDARTSSKSRAEDLVRTRKVLEQDLDRLGAGNTQAHLQKSRDLVLCLREIQYQRDQQRQLGDQIDAAIAAGKKGDIVDVDAGSLTTRVDEASLFHGDAEDDDDETPPLPGISANKRMDAETDAFKIPAATSDSSDQKHPSNPEKAGGPVAEVGKKSKKAAKA